MTTNEPNTGITVSHDGTHWKVEDDGYTVSVSNIEPKGAVMRALVLVDDTERNNLILDTINVASSHSRKRLTKELKDKGYDVDIDRVLRALDIRIRADLREQAEAMTQAVSAAEMTEEDRAAEAEEALAVSAGLLDDPRLWVRILRAFKRRGYAGDRRPPGTAYLAITSRLTERPANVAFIAQSSSGKTYAVTAATAFFPPSAYYEIDGMSPRALLFSPADFKHRTIIIGEADSLVEDGPAASAVRSIITDNKTVYEITIQGADGKYTTERIEKEGPTGAITTSTRPLPTQFNTRMLPITVRDDPGQIAKVLHVLADKVNGTAPEFNLTPFIAMQRWLELAGDREVTIPYAHTLADGVPHADPRMNRDYQQVLTFIQASAILHQRQRGRDGDGRIIATAQDYRIARWLLLDSFTAAATAGLTPIIREAVEALARLCEKAGIEGDVGLGLTITAVANAVEVPRGTMKWRLDRAQRLGYVVNLEERKRWPARLRIGDPLPDELVALPIVEEVCSETDSTDPTARQLPGSSVTAGDELSSADSTGVDTSDERSSAVESPLDSSVTAEPVAITGDPGIADPACRAVGSVEWGQGDTCIACGADVERFAPDGTPYCAAHFDETRAASS